MTVHNTADGFSIARTLLENDYAVLLTKEENGDIRVTAKRNAGAPTTSDDILFMTHAEWEIVLDEIYNEKEG